MGFLSLEITDVIFRDNWTFTIAFRSLSLLSGWGGDVGQTLISDCGVDNGLSLVCPFISAPTHCGVCIIYNYSHCKTSSVNRVSLYIHPSFPRGNNIDWD